MNSSNNLTKIIASVAVIVVAGGVAAYSLSNQSNEQVQNTTTDTTGAQTGNTQSSSNTGQSEYKDGTYTSNISYMSPGGKDSLGVTLTIKDGVVTNSSLKLGPGDQGSTFYQGQFESGYKSVVVGKKLSDLKLDRVSGASLTTAGFNEAVVNIRAQAKA